MRLQAEGVWDAAVLGLPGMEFLLSTLAAVELCICDTNSVSNTPKV